MICVVGVRFKKAGKVYYFSPANLEIKKHDFVIVETARGVEYGQVVSEIKEIKEEELISPLKPVLRLADEKDAKSYEDNKIKAKEALEICEEKVSNHGLEMKLIDVEYTFDNNKIIFYFTADGRVDFRELVKDLAAVFRTRIELRQIGVRDEAKMIGGLGLCGRHMCCASFLGDFVPVSIRMAKDQGLSLNPSKISGICGRLMCCLKYEHPVYEEVLERLPNKGSYVWTKAGKGRVEEINPITEKIRVKITQEDGGETLLDTHFSEIKIIKKNRVQEKIVETDDIKELLDEC